MLFIEYPNCSTVKKAKRYLEDKNITYNTRHIVNETPTKEELRQWLKKSGYDIKRFFNTSGQVYRALNLKDKLSTMTIDEKLELLSSNGMLIKRPIVVMKETVLVGFKASEWNEIFS